METLCWFLAALVSKMPTLQSITVCFYNYIMNLPAYKRKKVCLNLLSKSILSIKSLAPIPIVQSFTTEITPKEVQVHRTWQQVSGVSPCTNWMNSHCIHSLQDNKFSGWIWELSHSHVSVPGRSTLKDCKAKNKSPLNKTELMNCCKYHKWERPVSHWFTWQHHEDWEQ